MNLLGFDVTFSGKNGKYVKTRECHQAQNSIKESVQGLRGHFDTRIDDVNSRIEDLKDFMLKNGR